MATMAVPNLGNSRQTTLHTGVMHGHTQFANGGRSLDPMQRAGVVPHVRLPVEPAASGRSIQGNMVARHSIVAQPVILATHGNISHTRMWQYHL